MQDFNTIQSQFDTKIDNIYTFDVEFTDADNEIVRVILTNSKYYIWPLFKKFKIISELQFKLIKSIAHTTDNEEFTINACCTYNEFYNEFYNLNNALYLDDYINTKHGNERGSQSRFARKEGIKTPQVTQWLDKNFIVVDDVLYSPRRKLK